MCILNIAKGIKKMSINEIRDFENYYKPTGFSKESICYSMKRFKKKIYCYSLTN